VLCALLCCSLCLLSASFLRSSPCSCFLPALLVLVAILSSPWISCFPLLRFSRALYWLACSSHFSCSLSRPFIGFFFCLIFCLATAIFWYASFCHISTRLIRYPTPDFRSPVGAWSTSDRTGHSTPPHQTKPSNNIKYCRRRCGRVGRARPFDPRSLAVHVRRRTGCFLSRAPTHVWSSDGWREQKNRL